MTSEAIVMDQQQSRPPEAALITARLDRLPMTKHMWFLVIMIGAGAWFELYDLFFTGYIAPGLFKSGVFTATTTSFFGLTGLAGFLAALFTGLFIGTILCSDVADRFGRRTIFTFSLLWYSVATFILAFQDTASGLNFWRLVGAVGIGVEMVTVDAYISELAPKHARGKAMCMKDAIGYLCSPTIAFLAWLLVPLAPLGLDGWRWVILVGSLGAIPIWWIRMKLPESPRWLAQQGRLEEAEQVMAAIETKVAAQSDKPLPSPGLPAIEDSRRGRYREIFGPMYRGRTIMMMVVNFFQTIGYYGFISWIPTLLIAKGIHVTQSLQYTFVIALAYPLSPLIFMPAADRFQRKWQIAIACTAVAAVGMLFSQLNAARVADHRRLPAGCAGQLDGLCRPRLPVGAVPHARARARRRLRLFMEPLQLDLHRLLHRLLPAQCRRVGGIPVHRRGDGGGGGIGQPVWTALQPAGTGRDCTMTRDPAGFAGARRIQHNEAGVSRQQHQGANQWP